MHRALPLFALLVASACAVIGGDGNDPPRAAAATVDSQVAAEQVLLQGEIRALRDTAPRMLDSVRGLAAVSVQMQLSRLGYAAGPFEARLTSALERAIRRYERVRGLPEAGDPLSQVLRTQLEEDVARLEEAPQLPAKSVHFGDGYVMAQGAWSAEDLGAQWIAATVACTQQPPECHESQATYQRTFGDPTLSIHHEQYRIIQWDSIEVVAATEYPCARYLLRINRPQESAIKVRSTTSAADRCSHMRRADVVMRLESGVDRAIAEAGSRAFLLDSLAPMTPRTRALLLDGWKKRRVERASRP